MWKCEKCETINDGEFCAICGEPKPIKTTQQQPAQNANQPKTEQIKSEPVIPTPITPATKDSGNKLLIGVLLGVIIALTVLVAVFAIYIVGNRDNSGEDETRTVYVTESPDVTQEPTVVPVETEIPDEPAPTPEPINNDFVYGRPQSSFNLNPTYTRIYSNGYHWYCDIPDNFDQTEFGVDPAFEAKDGTAKMKIESKSNVYNKTLNEVRTEYLNDMNGVDVLKLSGNDWFAASFVVDGVAYYKKCYVDHYIRSFEFSFPKEYLDMGVYNDYIEHIEENFRRTDI